MPFHPFDIPDFNEVFGSDAKLLRTFRKAGIADVTIPMIMPQGTRSRIKGVGEVTDKRITAMLRRWSIERRTHSVGLYDYLEDQFGQIDFVPASALQVAIVREGNISYPMYSPLELVTAVCKHSPQMTVTDIVNSGAEGLRYIIEGTGHPDDMSDYAVDSIQEDLKHLKWRLDYLGLTLPFSAAHMAPSGAPKLHAVV